MSKLELGALRTSLEARTLQERVVILVALGVLGVFLWVELALDPLAARRANLERQLGLSAAQFNEQQDRQRDIQDSSSKDPDAMVRGRLGQLQAETREVDERLNELYGQLITPREMSNVLTDILRKETSLRLVSLENLAPTALFQSDLDATPLVGPAPEQVASSGEQGLRVYKHGLRMVLEGSYLETLSYLQSLEALDANFFWEDLRFETAEYPRGRIEFSIFTLSTRQEWIGV